MQLWTITFLPHSMTEIMYYLNYHMHYLESVAELVKIFSSIEHQSAETYLWKWHIAILAQIYYATYKTR